MRPSSPWLTVPLDGFVVTAGAPVAYRSSAAAWRQFCGRCGTPLSWQAVDNPRLIDVAIATLDDPAPLELEPARLVRAEIPWFDTADHLPRCPTNQRPAPAR